MGSVSFYYYCKENEEKHDTDYMRLKYYKPFHLHDKHKTYTDIIIEFNNECVFSPNDCTYCYCDYYY